MGFFLPSETARLVVSYLLDHNFNDTADKFMVECPYVQELKSLTRNQLKHHSRVNDRTLMDILREYNGLKTAITGLSEQLSDVPRDGDDFPMFEAPLRTLNRLGSLIKESKSTPVVTDTNSTQTGPPSDIPSSSRNQTSSPSSNSSPPSPLHSFPPEHVVQQLPQASPFPIITSPSQQPQRALPLSTVQVPPTQTTPQITLASTHSTPFSLPQEPLPLHIIQQTPSPDHRRSSSQPSVPGPDNITPRSQSTSPSKHTINQSSHFFHSNIRVFPRLGYVPILPKPGDPLAPPTDPQPSKRGRKSQRKKGLDNVSGSSHFSPAPNTTPGVLSSSLVGSDQHFPSTSNTVLIPSPSLYTPPTADTSHRSQLGVRKSGRRSVDDDEDLLNELLGLGDQIATMINTQAQGGDISGMVDKGLDNPELQDNLHNLLDLFNTEPSSLLDEEQVNTPVSSPVPEVTLNNSTVMMENQDGTKGFDSTLTDMEVTTDSIGTEEYPVNDALALLVNSTIKTVTAEFNKSPEDSGKKDKVIKDRKRRRKASPRKKGQVKKKREMSPTSVTLAESPSINFGLNTFRMQFKSVLNNSLPSQASTSCPAEEILSNFTVADDEIKEEDIIDEKDDSITIVDNLQNIVGVDQSVEIINEEVIAQLLAGSKKRHRKCKKCQGCKKPNCGQCKPCVDMVEFGGKGFWKKACELRKCTQQQQQEEMIECDLQVVAGEPQVVLETDKDEDMMLPPPQHVRSLMFSPGEEGERGKGSPVFSVGRKGKKRRSPLKRRSRELGIGSKTPEKSILKTLSPVKQPESPIKETNPAWNQDLKVMFTAEPIKSSIPFTEEVWKNMTTPICISKKITVPLGTGLPSTVVPVSPSTIPPEVLQALPPGFRSAGFQAIISDTVKTHDSVTESVPSSSNPSSVPLVAPSVLSVASSVPSIPSSSVPPLSHLIDLPVSQPESKYSEEEIESKKPIGNETSAKNMTLIVTNAKKPSVEQYTVKKLKDTSPKVMSWDEKLRASLGAAEKDMSHITHKIPDGEKGRRRRSPRKRRRVDRPESDEDEEDYVEEDEGTTLPELGLEDADITPEAQRILDTFANKLLEQLEESADKKVVFVDEDEDYLADRKLFGKTKKNRKPCQEKKNGKDCIECRLLDCVEERPLSPGTGMPFISNSPLKPNSDHVSAGKGKSKEEVSSSDGTVLKDPVADMENNDEKGRATDTSVESAVSSTSTYVAKPMASSDLDLETSPVPTPFKTPQKSDSFLFKTPSKTPRTPRMTRHLLASPLQHLMSPQMPCRRLAVPGTPSRPTFSPKEVEPSSPGTLNTPGRDRHPSSLSTPVHEAPDQLAAPSLLPLVPTTPTSKAPLSPAVPYFTPSPASQASRGSSCTTPGLRFLQAEGERLSHSEDSMSPTKSEKVGKRKSFRNCLFNKGSSMETKLGTLLEQKISSYQFQEELGGKHGPAPFMGLDRPSPSGQTPQQASFVSPNRTCYLSPTAMALSSNVLGFYQSPRNTDDSDNTDLEMDDKEVEKKRLERVVDHDEIIIYNNPDVTVSMETATDSAVQDTEETIEAIQACVNESFQSHSVRNLLDESNTASLPQPPLSQKQSEEIVVSPEFPSLVLSEGSDSEADEDVMVPVSATTERKIKTFRKVGSFVESFLEANSKDNIEEEKTVAKPKETETTRQFTPRKPRRVQLVSTSRKSPLKNDATMFERSNDVNNLDRSLPESAGKILEKENMGENLGTALEDLGLEPEIGFGQQKKGKAKFSLIETRKSPRKIKSSGAPQKSGSNQLSANQKGDGRPQKKRLKMSEFEENRELSLQFSPRKSKRQALADVSRVSSAAIGSPDKMTVSLPGSLGVYTSPSVCEALGLRPVKNKSLPLDEGSSDQTKCSKKKSEDESLSPDALSLLSKLEEARPKNCKKQIEKVSVKKKNDGKEKSVLSSVSNKEGKAGKSSENVQDEVGSSKSPVIQKKQDTKHEKEKTSVLIKHPDKKLHQKVKFTLGKEEFVREVEITKSEAFGEISDKKGKESASVLIKPPGKKIDLRKKVISGKEETLTEVEISKLWGKSGEISDKKEKENEISEKEGTSSQLPSARKDQFQVNKKKKTDTALTISQNSEESSPTPDQNSMNKSSASDSSSTISSMKTDRKKQGNKERSRSKSQDARIDAKPSDSISTKPSDSKDATDDGKLRRKECRKSTITVQSESYVKETSKPQVKADLSDNVTINTSKNTDLDISVQTEKEDGKVEPHQKLGMTSSTSCLSPSNPDSTSSQGIQGKDKKQELTLTDNKEFRKEKEMTTTSKSEGQTRGRSSSSTKKGSLRSDVKDRSKSKDGENESGKSEANICRNKDATSSSKSELEEVKGKTKEKLQKTSSTQDDFYNKVKEARDKRQDTKRTIPIVGEEESKIKDIRSTSKSKDNYEQGSVAKLGKDCRKSSSGERSKSKGELTKVDRKVKKSVVSNHKDVSKDQQQDLPKQSVTSVCSPLVTKPKPVKLPSNQDGNTDEQGKFISLVNPDVNKHAGNITVNKFGLDKKESSNSDSQVGQKKDKIQPESSAPLPEVSLVSDQKESKQKWKPKQIISLDQKKSAISQSSSGDKLSSEREERKTPTITIKSPSRINKEENKTPTITIKSPSKINKEENKTPTITIKSPSKINKETKLAEEKERSRSKQLEASTVRKSRPERDPVQKSFCEKAGTADEVLQTSHHILVEEVSDTSPRRTRSMSSGTPGNKSETRPQSQSPEKRIPNILRKKTPTRKPLVSTNTVNETGGHPKDRSITLDHVGITSALNKAKEKQESSSSESNVTKNLNIDQLAESSAKLLSSLGMKAPQRSDQCPAELPIEDPNEDIEKEKNCPPSVISISPFFIFLDKKPFGVFDGDD